MQIIAMTASTPAALTMLLVAAIASPGAGGTAAAQGTFEGSITYTVTGLGKEGMTIRYSRKGSMLRQDMSVPGAPAGMATIHNSATSEAITLIPQQKKYLVMNYKTMGEGAKKMAASMSGGGGGSRPAMDFSAMNVTPTGQHETIVGIRCDHYLFSKAGAQDDHKVDICGASGMGFFSMTGDVASSAASTMALMRSQNPQLAQLASKGFFALKMTVMSKGQPVSWQATQVDRHPLDDSMFKPPSDYTKLTLPGIPGLKP
jgi:hypothetical protein